MPKLFLRCPLVTLLATWILIANTVLGHELRLPVRQSLEHGVAQGDASPGMMTSETGWKVWERPLRFDTPRSLVIGMILAGLAGVAWFIFGSSIGRATAGSSMPSSMTYRFAYRIAAGIFTVVVAYGSLVPFQLRDIGFTTALQEFRDTVRHPQIDFSWADFAANSILFVPLGFSLMGATLRPKSRRFEMVTSVLATLLLSGTVSLAIEFGQTWIPQRIPSRDDLIAQQVGTLLGIAAWLVVGADVTAQLALLRQRRQSRHAIQRVITLFVLALTICSLLPLDLTIRPHELAKKYHAGRMVVVPFTDPVPTSEFLSAMVLNLLLFALAGLLIAWTTAESWHTGYGVSIGLGIVFVIALELTQLLVYSRSASSTDLITGSIGVLLGVLAASLCCSTGADRRGRS